MSEKTEVGSLAYDDILLDATYWSNRYETNNIGWDLGCVSPAIKNYIDSLENKCLAILIPGCGNSYEADYLLEKSFSNVTVIDIAPKLGQALVKKFSNNKNIRIIEGDFFKHNGQYDIIIEQTFFCALNPSLRLFYASKMHQLLKEDGILTGLLFNRNFEQQGPPFGGTETAYKNLFENKFNILKLENCINSIAPRLGSELWFEFVKKNQL